MSKIYYSITIILSLFIISSCGPGSLPSESSTLYQVTITAEPEEAGSVSPTLVEADEGEEIEITALPNESWAFDSWQGDYNGSTNPAKITVTSDKNISAYFIKIDYPLTVNVEGEGTVSDQIVDEENQIIQLTANSADGWRFVEWKGDVNGTDNPAELMMDEAKEVTAVFEPVDDNGDNGDDGDDGDDGDNGDDGDDGDGDDGAELFKLSTTSKGEGSISPESGDYEEGTDVELTATADAGWSFSHWEGDLSGSINPQTITMDSDKSVTAVFEEDTDFFDLNILIEGEGLVEVSLQSGNESNGSYQDGSVVEVRAIPGDEWSFYTWEGDLNGKANPRTIKMNSDKSVTAVFEEDDDDDDDD